MQYNMQYIRTQAGSGPSHMVRCHAIAAAAVAAGISRHVDQSFGWPPPDHTGRSFPTQHVRQPVFSTMQVGQRRMMHVRMYDVCGHLYTVVPVERA